VAGLLVCLPAICAWQHFFKLNSVDELAVSSHAMDRRLNDRNFTDLIQDIPRRLGTSNGYPPDPFIDEPYHTSNSRYLVFIHIIFIAYMLLGLNTVCDLYFTGALDEMVMKWNIKPDVAGATFMAAGGSAPELFTSLIGAVISESDVGFGTIVGSAVFNVLFVIGLCGFAAKTPIKLTWWPLFRDCTYYILGLSVLAVCAKTGGEITLLEAVVLFTGYLGYCTLMYFNPQLEARFVKGEGPAGGLDDVNPVEMTPVTPVADTGSTSDKHHIKKSQPHFERRNHGPERTASHGPTPGMTKSHSKEHIIDLDEDGQHSKDAGATPSTGGPTSCGEELEDVPRIGSERDEEEEEDEDDIEELLLRPEGTLPFALWCLSLPIYIALYYGIPKPTEKRFMFTFAMSLIWIAGFSFVLVYCVEILGGVLNIHIIVMGFTLLAAGTSIPDLVSSMAVARAGEGDMAVSSSIGSNIFDILVGLPIPWIIKIVVVEMISKGKPEATVKILSAYIVFYVLVLVVMVFCVILSIHALGWYLNRTLGVGMAFLYAIFLIIVLSVEFSEPEALKI